MPLEFLIVMAIAALVFWFVLWPLRGDAPAADGVDERLELERDRVQLAKDRKLDEIRELRHDRAAGKLSAADAGPLERELRGQAAELLHELDAIEAQLDDAATAVQTREAVAPPIEPLP